VVVAVNTDIPQNIHMNIPVCKNVNIICTEPNFYSIY
jgi:hypothetical protein